MLLATVARRGRSALRAAAPAWRASTSAASARSAVVARLFSSSEPRFQGVDFPTNLFLEETEAAQPPAPLPCHEDEEKVLSVLELLEPGQTDGVVTLDNRCVIRRFSWLARPLI